MAFYRTAGNEGDAFLKVRKKKLLKIVTKKQLACTALFLHVWNVGFFFSQQHVIKKRWESVLKMVYSHCACPVVGGAVGTWYWDWFVCDSFFDLFK